MPTFYHSMPQDFTQNQHVALGFKTIMVVKSQLFWYRSAKIAK